MELNGLTTEATTDFVHAKGQPRPAVTSKMSLKRQRNNREPKQRQRERHKFAYLVSKNNSFARPARAFSLLSISLPASAKQQREKATLEFL